MKEKGPHRSVVDGVGAWRSLAFKGYVDTTLDVERDMTKLLIETAPPPDEAGEVHTLGNGVPRGEMSYFGRLYPVFYF